MSTERPMNKKALKRKLNRQFQKTETRKIKVDNYLRILNQSYPNDYVSSSSDESALISNYSFEQIFEEQTESEVGVVDDAQSSGSANVSEEELGENIREINESDSDEFNEFHQNNSDEDGNDDDDDDNAIAFIDDHERGLYVYETIRQWALQGGCLSMTKLDALLTQLHSVFPEVPRSYKTLLATPKHLDVIELEDNNQMWYKSVGANLDSMNLQEYLQRFNKITIDVNVDGLPLSKSSKQKFWPILGKLVGSKNEPFIIAVHHGNSDPKVNEFLMDFVLEIQDLSENGYIYNNHIYEFIVRHYICDAPARALIKGIIEHGGYYACEKCTVVENSPFIIKLNLLLKLFQQFVVFKFINQEDSDSEFYDIGLAQWLETEMDIGMKTKIKWPTDSKIAGDFVRKEKPAHPSWSSLDILVKRFYDTYINAVEACKQFLYDSNYESSKEMGRGHRIKRKSNRLESSSEEEQNEANHVKYGNNYEIPSPPCVKLDTSSIFSKRESQNLKRNASSKIEIIDNKKSKKSNNILQHLRRSNDIGTVQNISMKNDYNMEGTSQSELYSSSTANANFSSSVSSCHSESNLSNKENTESNIVEKNVSQHKNESQINNWMEEGFDVKNQGSSSSLRSEMATVSSKLDIVIMNQERLNRFIMPHEKLVKRPNNLPPLPLKTERELTEMEKFLSEENNLSATCGYMSRYVNLQKVRASTFRILRNIMNNSLAKQFSLHGCGTKKAFQSLKLYSVIEGAFVSKDEKINLSLVESATSLWLVNATWRKQEDGSSHRSFNSHEYRTSRSPFSNKNHTSESSLLSVKESHMSKQSSHRSSKDKQRLKEKYKNSNHPLSREYHRFKEKAGSRFQDSTYSK